MAEEIPAPVNGINTLNEKSLHAALKKWYALPDDRLEVPVDGYIIDLVRGDLLIEIQTGSFSPLKRKLAQLVKDHPVRLVFPIPLEKWIITLPKDGKGPARRRKSPKRGCVEQIFSQLVYIPALMNHVNFSLEVLLIREEETRAFDATRAKAWRRKGWVTQERRLLEVVERRIFETPDDLCRRIPAGLQDPFTARELAKAANQPVWLAQKMVYCLRIMDQLTLEGKRGRAAVYARRVETERTGESDL